MTTIVTGSLAAVLALPVALAMWRQSEARTLRAVWNTLSARQPATRAVFDPASVAGLPDPAQRFFRFAIAPGTPLYPVAEISMRGEINLGSKAQPNAMPMRAEQILAAPYGFIWKVHAGKALWVEGSDGACEGTSWSRFWMLGLLPVARAGHSDDHLRSAFGRCVADALIWAPAALLPGDAVRWQVVDQNCARVTVSYRHLTQSADVVVDAQGRALNIVLPRWSDANADKTYRLQPFGGELSAFREFDGYRLPTHVEAGNCFGTDDYFPFFNATVTSTRFPRNGD